MTADDVRWLAQKVVAKAFHGVSDASVEALARRVLELESTVERIYDGEHGWECTDCGRPTANGTCTQCRHGTSPPKLAVKAEREACAQLAAQMAEEFSDTALRAAPYAASREWNGMATTARELAEKIRARGAR